MFVSTTLLQEQVTNVLLVIMQYDEYVLISFRS